MAQFPAFPLWTDAYLGDTTHLTTIEHGAYLLLLIIAWRSKDGTLPDDDYLLARYTKLSKAQWRRVKPILEPFYTIENGKWIQQRLIDELDAVRQFSKRQSKKGKARWLKNKDSSIAGVSSGLNPSDASPTPTPTPTPITLKEGIGKGLEKPSPFPTELILLWNKIVQINLTANGGKVILSKTRIPKLKRVLKDYFDNRLDNWGSYCESIANTPFLMGDNDRQWRVTIDWALEPKNLIKVLEGNYVQGPSKELTREERIAEIQRNIGEEPCKLLN